MEDTTMNPVVTLLEIKEFLKETTNNLVTLTKNIQDYEE